jgi:disulfide bond formation protein DsbB
VTILELNYLVALGTIALQAVTAVLLVLYFFRTHPVVAPLANFIGTWGVTVGFLLALFGVAMSLVYSEYFGVVPCGLCWFQRIFLYPQAVIFGLALIIKDAKAWAYGLWLSIIGAAVSLYHHYMQIGGGSDLPCPASGGDCGKRFIYEFDYVTFPLVAFSMFAFIIVLMLFVRARAKHPAP